MRIPVPEAIQRIAASEDRILAWHFFVFFSRFEYALKRCDEYLTVSAQPNWDKFASDHANQFDNLESIALKAAAPTSKRIRRASNFNRRGSFLGPSHKCTILESLSYYGFYEWFAVLEIISFMAVNFL